MIPFLSCSRDVKFEDHKGGEQGSTGRGKTKEGKDIRAKWRNDKRKQPVAGGVRVAFLESFEEKIDVGRERQERRGCPARGTYISRLRGNARSSRRNENQISPLRIQRPRGEDHSFAKFDTWEGVCAKRYGYYSTGRPDQVWVEATRVLEAMTEWNNKRKRGAGRDQ